MKTREHKGLVVGQNGKDIAKKMVARMTDEQRKPQSYIGLYNALICGTGEIEQPPCIGLDEGLSQCAKLGTLTCADGHIGLAEAIIADPELSKERYEYRVWPNFVGTMPLHVYTCASRNDNDELHKHVLNLVLTTVTADKELRTEAGLMTGFISKIIVSMDGDPTMTRVFDREDNRRRWELVMEPNFMKESCRLLQLDEDICKSRPGPRHGSRPGSGVPGTRTTQELQTPTGPS